MMSHLWHPLTAACVVAIAAWSLVGAWYFLYGRNRPMVSMRGEPGWVAVRQCAGFVLVCGPLVWAMVAGVFGLLAVGDLLGSIPGEPGSDHPGLRK